MHYFFAGKLEAMIEENRRYFAAQTSLTINPTDNNIDPAAPRIRGACALILLSDLIVGGSTSLCCY